MRTIDDLPYSVRQALATFSARVRARFGDRVRDVVLFGSQARGDAREDSDVDVCVVVDDLTHDERMAISDIAFRTDLDAGDEGDVGLSVLPLSTAERDLLRARERRIAHDIDTEGIRL